LNICRSFFDERLAIFTDYVRDKLSVKLSLEHMSSHLADGIYGGLNDVKTYDREYLLKIENLLEGYSREFIKLIVGYQLPFVQVYAGLNQTLRIASPHELKGRSFLSPQLGHNTSIKLFKSPLSIFFSSDFQFLGEFSYDLNQNHYFGLGYHINERAAGVLRVFLNYFSGHDTRGPYWSRTREYLGVGISMPLVF